MGMRLARTCLVAVAVSVLALYVGVALSLFPAPTARTVARSDSTLPGAFGSRVSGSTMEHAPDPDTPSQAEETTVEVVSITASEFDATAIPSEMRTVRCPSFSGPGYDKSRHPSHDIRVPRLDAPYKGSPRSSTSAASAAARLEPLPLADVRLATGSSFERAFQTNLNFLRSVDVSALLLTWRLTAKQRWPKGAMRLMGWEHTGSELRGHFLGHWLSATAFSYAATHDAALASALADTLGVLEEVAKAHQNGYLSAFPESFLERLEAITPVWAPYYTLHKVLAGLLNVGRHLCARRSYNTGQGLAEGGGVSLPELPPSCAQPPYRRCTPLLASRGVPVVRSLVWTGEATASQSPRARRPPLRSGSPARSATTSTGVCAASSPPSRSTISSRPSTKSVAASTTGYGRSPPSRASHGTWLSRRSSTSRACSARSPRVATS